MLRALGFLKKPPPGLVTSNVVIPELHTPLIPNKRACRFRQALLFKPEVVLISLLLRFHDQEGAASVWTTNAQQDFLLVGLLYRRVEFIDVCDRLFGH